jgi:hypothetical protein
MKFALITALREECRQHGRGRKAWWARKIGIPPLTFSHWLAGRQRPNGHHALAIKAVLEEVTRKKNDGVWENRLWECYFSNQGIPDPLLPPILLEVLSGPSLKVRTAALLVRLAKDGRSSFPTPASPILRNRVGWLLETAGLKAPFSPDRSVETQPLFLEASGSSAMKNYLRRRQTSHGRKWKIYDSSLDETVESLP